MPNDEQITYIEQRHAALDEALDREITFLRMQKATIPTTPWQKERQMLLTFAGLPNVRFHDLRHSAATLLFAMGVHPKIVQELLGHRSVVITLSRASFNASRGDA